MHEDADYEILSDDEDMLTQPVGLDSVSEKKTVRMPKNKYAASEREEAKRYKTNESQSASSTDPPPTAPQWPTNYTAYPSRDTSGQASRKQAADGIRRGRQLMKQHPSIRQGQQMSNFYCRWCGTTDHDSNACTFYCKDCDTYGHHTDKCPMWYTTKNARA